MKQQPQKKTILFINGHLNTGGCERSLVDVLKNIDYSKYDVDLLLLEGYGDYYSEVPKDVKCIMYPLSEASGPFAKTICKLLRKGSFLLCYYRIISVICSFWGYNYLRLLKPFTKDINNHYDTVIAYRTENPMMFARYVISSPNKIVWWHHGEMNIVGEKQLEHNKAFLKFNKIVAVSNSTKLMVEETFPNSRGKVVCIPNMIDITAFNKKADEPVMLLPTKPSLYIVSVGRLSQEKNMIFCVEVAKEISQRGLNIQWTIIGDGQEFEKINQKIKEFKLEKIINLTGSLSNPYPFIKKADILFHPSLVESQGITILEAMALNTAVITISSAGPKEYIINNENGIMISNNVIEAAEAIVRLSKDFKLKKRLETNAQATIGQFSPICIIQQIESII